MLGLGVEGLGLGFAVAAVARLGTGSRRAEQGAGGQSREQRARCGRAPSTQAPFKQPEGGTDMSTLGPAAEVVVCEAEDPPQQNNENWKQALAKVVPCCVVLK